MLWKQWRRRSWTDERASSRNRAGQRTENPDAPVGASSVTSMPVTSAAGGPARHQATALATSSSSPSKTASTVPSDAVAHPAGEAERVGVATARLAKPHALHKATHDHAVTDAPGHRVTNVGSTPQAQVRVISSGSIVPLPFVSVPQSSRTSRAAHVSSSTTPVTVNSSSVWNARTA